jgi:hypothetical protein
MIVQLKHIINGWSNYLLHHANLLSKDIQKKGEDRFNICLNCEIRVNNICAKSKKGIDVKTQEEKNGCGCVLYAKVLVEDAACPLNKW